MAEKITVLIPCKNERKNIRDCLAGVQAWADEILIADSGSTDGTLDIVREIGGCRIIEREFVNMGDFKNWAIPQASHPWVFVLDADERVTPELTAEIQQVLERPMADGYWVYRHNYFMGHRIRFSQWRTDCVLRLFRRDGSTYVGNYDHAEVAVSSGRVGELRERLHHFTYWTYDQYFQKFHRYTTYQASKWHAEGVPPSFLKLLFNLPLRFFYNYVVRFGFLDGMAGLQVCMLIAIYSFVKQARLWEQYHALPQPDPEATVARTPSVKRVAVQVPEPRGPDLVPVDERAFAVGTF